MKTVDFSGGGSENINGCAQCFWSLGEPLHPVPICYPANSDRRSSCDLIYLTSVTLWKSTKCHHQVSKLNQHNRHPRCARGDSPCCRRGVIRKRIDLLFHPPRPWTHRLKWGWKGASSLFFLLLLLLLLLLLGDGDGDGDILEEGTLG